MLINYTDETTVMQKLFTVLPLWLSRDHRGYPSHDNSLHNQWFNLGQKYQFGKVVGKDLKEAAKWYRKAAEQGNAFGQLKFGIMRLVGQGVPEDNKEAVKLIRKAANQGNAMGQFVLGGMYHKGLGVPEDNVTAYAWLNIAAVNGLANGKEAKDSAAKKMTPEQIAKAEALAKEMIAKNPKLIKKP